MKAVCLCAGGLYAAGADADEFFNSYLLIEGVVLGAARAEYAK